MVNQYVTKVMPKKNHCKTINNISEMVEYVTKVMPKTLIPPRVPYSYYTVLADDLVYRYVSKRIHC